MKLNEKYATGRAGKRYETQKQQREATPKLHQRSLARSIAKGRGAGKEEWRNAVAELPKTGRKRIHPKESVKA